MLRHGVKSALNTSVQNFMITIIHVDMMLKNLTLTMALLEPPGHRYLIFSGLWCAIGLCLAKYNA